MQNMTIILPIHLSVFHFRSACCLHWADIDQHTLSSLVHLKHITKITLSYIKIK